MVNKGDRIILKKQMGILNSIGEVYEVTDVTDECICFRFGGMHLGCVSKNEFDKFFNKYEKPDASITAEYIADIISNSEIKVDTVFGKCTIVSCKLPNGFVITESSACVSSSNYSEEKGVEICMRHIVDKVWELEGYMLQEEIYNEFSCEEDYYNENCEKYNAVDVDEDTSESEEEPECEHDWLYKDFDNTGRNFICSICGIKKHSPWE